MRIIGKQRQLFVDDEIVASLDNVSRVMHAPVKFGGNPVLTREEPWEYGMPSLYGTVMRDPDSGLFKMWYTIVTLKGTEGFNLGYATSTDGIQWERPRLGIFASQGSMLSTSADNNLIEIGLAMPSVLYTPWDPDPRQRYKMLAGVSPGQGHQAWIGLFSADGIHWQRNPEPIFPTGKTFLPGDESTAMWDPYTLRYVAFPKVRAGAGKRLFGREKRRSVALSFSDDFIHWTMPEVVFTPDAQDDENTARRNVTYRQRLDVDQPADYTAEWYNMNVHPYEGLYLGLVSVFDASGAAPYGNQDGTMHIQLVSSRDLRHWNRLGNREPFIELGAAGSWESEMVNGASTEFVTVGDDIWIYYSGFPFSHEDEALWQPEEAKGYPRLRPGGVGLAKLRRDGFVSIDGDAQSGSVTTHPFQWEGDQLWLNGVAATGEMPGEITCELLDGPGDPIPGFTQADCVPFTGDSVRHPVSWQHPARLPAPAIGPIRLRVYLKRARLFSFWFE
ncbi:MAG: hypothetical protein EXR62_08000 [Chloroflexi bacterium]|nr:hypothetical protein [Chloroflexota bacterium]